MTALRGKVRKGEGKMSGRQGLICIRSAALMIFRLLVAGSCMLALKACGGGSNSSDPIPPNTPPIFDQSLYTLSVVEGGSAIGVVAATDAEADNLVYSVSGEDAESLVISGTGRLSFQTPADYERPNDSDENNEYSVLVTASDGVLSATADVIITVENDPSDDAAAQQILFGFEVLVGSVTTPVYDRPSTWDDADGDCISDRHEILIAQHRDGDGAYPLVMSSDGCFVQTGRWLDPYDNIYYYAASDVQIDHVVALYESWISGLGNIDASAQRRYANTGSVSAGVLPETSHNFLAVGASSNGEKGSSDPTGWMPRNEMYHCTYLKKWVLTKSQSGLLFDQAEFDFIQGRASDCDNEPLPALPANP